MDRTIKIVVAIIFTLLIPPIGLILSLIFISRSEMTESKTPYYITFTFALIFTTVLGLLIWFIAQIPNAILESVEEIELMGNQTYEENIELCTQKTNILQKGLCMGAGLSIHENDTRVISGEYCDEFSSSNKLREICLIETAELTLNEDVCNKFTETAQIQACLGKVYEDPTSCDNLSNDEKDTCLGLLAQ